MEPRTSPLDPIRNLFQQSPVKPLFTVSLLFVASHPYSASRIRALFLSAPGLGGQRSRCLANDLRSVLLAGREHSPLVASRMSLLQPVRRSFGRPICAFDRDRF